MLKNYLLLFLLLLLLSCAKKKTDESYVAPKPSGKSGA